MIRRFAIRILIYILVGLIIQILTSMYWFKLPVYGEEVFMLGQAAGEMIYFYTFRMIFKFFNFNEGVYIMEGIMGLIFIDILTIIWFNPYEISVPKYGGCIFAAVIIISRLTVLKNESQKP